MACGSVHSSAACLEWLEDLCYTSVSIHVHVDGVWDQLFHRTDLTCLRCTHSHGAQGVFDHASKASLENEFGTSKDDECIQQILERGEIQESSVRSCAS